MNVKILRKISENVKLEKVGKKYRILQLKEGKWVEVYSSTNFDRAQLSKHNAWLNILYKLGHTSRLLNRRKMRERKRQKNK